MSNEVIAAVSYGMGGDAIDSAASSGGGEDYFVARLKAKKVDTLNSVYNWDQLQQIVDDVCAARRKNPAVKIVLSGDSLGDNELGDLLVAFEQAGIQIDLIAGFQGSEWGKHTSITENCKRALIIFNPNWIETMGLGDYALPLVIPPTAADIYDGIWHLGNNGKTWVRYVELNVPHPGDWGQAQDLAFNEIMKLQAA